jgi:hypothetical protein
MIMLGTTALPTSTEAMRLADEAKQLLRDAFDIKGASGIYKPSEAAKAEAAACAAIDRLAALSLNAQGGEPEEGCTPADVRVLRAANLDLAAESHKLQEALADLYQQIKRFCEAEGEADFETGRALHLLSRLRPLEFAWPFAAPPVDKQGAPAQPEWRCFHCNAVFKNTVDAAFHFGYAELEKPACLVNEVELRNATWAQAVLGRFAVWVGHNIGHADYEGLLTTDIWREVSSCLSAAQKSSPIAKEAT